MPVPLLDLRAQYSALRDSMTRALLEHVETQQFILGEPVDALEREVAELSRTRFAVGCASGTDALLLALRALDIGAGDEVVTTPFTFFATAGAIHNVGARPVFADIDDATFNLDPVLAAEAVTPRTKAVIPVDLFGQIAAIEQFRAHLPELPIIEDAAQSIGARRKIEGSWTVAGERATMGTLSFFPSKNLGGYGDGGMVLTQDGALAERLRRLRVHGGMRQYHHEEVGYNSRLDALQAVVLRAKLPNLSAWSAARREHARYYDAAFADVPEVRTPVIDPANECIYNQYTLRVPRRDALQQALREQGIGSAVYYPLCLHQQPCFAYLGHSEGDFPAAERAAAEVLSLPVFPELTTAQQDEVIAAVRGFYGR
jgi:dTDP-4-amino-4,6-dideoxygalactose transaminase